MDELAKLYSFEVPGSMLEAEFTNIWQQVEDYVSRHTEVQFSHSVCPVCMKQIYPEFCKDE